MSEPRAIGLLNRSKIVKQSDFVAMLSAINFQLQNEFKEAWDLDCFVVSADNEAALGAYDVRITIADSIDDPDALGYHTQLPGNVIWGIVGCAPVIKAGGAILVGGDMTIPTIASVLSHEVLETAADPFVNLWADSPEGFQVAREVCDPCEATQYEQKDTDGNIVVVSDFVLPSWFNPYDTGKTSFCNATPGPFQLAAGGYIMRRSAGRPTSVFGRSHLPWKKEGVDEATSRRKGRRIALSIASESIHP